MITKNNLEQGKTAEVEPAAEFSEQTSLYAERKRVYPRSVRGKVRNVKWAILIFCLGVYYILPWLRWTRSADLPSQAVLLDIASRRFFFFGLEIWPQELYFLTGLLIVSAIALFLVTSIAGRLWCGYACPQTVWTDLFMWVERIIEGDRGARIRLDNEPLTFNKIWRKTLKHGLWLVIAMLTGGAWITYYVDTQTLIREVFTGQSSTTVYFFIGLFTFTTYSLAGWAREQVCTYMCPWPRFQSAMFDDETITVTYQKWRGEPRRPYKAGSSWEGRGDCIDCKQCIDVCPTGIDIRNGIQLECINCGLCMDACNNIMARVDRPGGLIRWDSLVNQTARAAGQQPNIHLIRPRTLVYAGLLSATCGLILYAFLTRVDFTLSVEHDRMPLFVKLSDLSISNGYQLQIVNKTSVARDFVLSTKGIEGGMISAPELGIKPSSTLTLPVHADSVTNFRILVRNHAGVSSYQPFNFVLNSPDGRTAETKSAFIAPKN